VLQVALVAYKHGNDIWIRVVAQLLQPPSDVYEGLVVSYVVDQEGASGTTVIAEKRGIC
jgi:hypothetical protein